MGIKWDAASGRMVRESEADRLKREAEARMAREGFEANQSQWDRMRTMTAEERKRQTAYRQKQEDSRLSRDEELTPPKPMTAAEKKAAEAAARAAAKREQDARMRQAGMQAVRGFEGLARSGSEDALARIAGLYDPQMSAAEASRDEELRLLRDALMGARGSIDSATQEYLQNLAPTRAFENVPLIALEAQENPLLAALASQGAGTGEIEAQRGLDTALANQLRALSERSAQQYGATESSYMDALRRSALGGQMAGQQYLSTRGAEAEAGIGSRYADLLNELRTGRTKAEADVATQLQEALTKAFEERFNVQSKYPAAPKPAAKPKTVTAPKVTPTVTKPKPKTGGSTTVR
jgi:hypothetical protein